MSLRRFGSRIREEARRRKLRHRFAIQRSYLVNLVSLTFSILGSRLFSKKRKVVVISQIFHLGDIVACEPMVRQMRRKRPDAFIVLALKRPYRELSERHPEVNHTLAVECLSEWAKFVGCKLFDEIIDLNMPGRPCPVCRVPWVSPGGDHGVTKDNYYNIGSLLKAYSIIGGIEMPPDGPRVYPAAIDAATLERFALPKVFVVLHAGSNESSRTLPVSKWVQIVEYINDRWGIGVVEIGIKRLALSQSGHLNHSLCGQLTILQSAEVIRCSTFYIGTDSGPAHLANASGAYGIILLGHYRHFKHYVPYNGRFAEGKGCELLYHDGPVAEIATERVFEAIDRRLNFLHLVKIKPSEA